MKNSTLILLLSLFLINCKKETPYDLSGTHQLTQGIPVVISKNKLPVTMSFTTMNDTPCPPNALCIWDGCSIYVTFKTSQEDNIVNIFTQACNGIGLKNDIVILNGISYEVKLKEIKTVSRHPVKATILLTKTR